MKIYDNTSGSMYEYTEENGLISKDGIVLSGEQYEPVFTVGLDGTPSPCGIFLRHEGRFLSKSGNLGRIEND